MSYEEIEKIIDNPNYKKFVIENDNEILAFMILQITDEVNVFNIVTKSGFRNLGLATKLLSKAEEIAKVLGLNLSLEVSDKNLTAYVFYEKNGFVTRRVRKCYYKDKSNCIEMFKVVS